MNNLEYSGYSDFTTPELYEEYLKLKSDNAISKGHPILNALKLRLNIPENIKPTERSINEFFNFYLLREGIDSGRVFASRGDRLLASFFDVMIIFIPSLFIALFLGATDFKKFLNSKNFEHSLIIFFAGQLFYIAINGRLLIKQGQSVGKKLLKIKIVNTEGRLPIFTQIYGMRYLIPALVYLIPFFGWFISIIDCLFIFRDDRRCLHDIIANTRVVKTRA